MIAKIAVSAANFAIDKPYSYRVPAGMEVSPGQRVQIPFGRGNRFCEGVVLATEDKEDESLKTIALCLDEAPVLSPTMLRLAAFLRERCFCTFFEAIRAMLPAGLWFQEKGIYALTEDRSWQDKTLRKAGAMEILTYLQRLGGQADSAALKELGLDADAQTEALAYLAKKKWITAEKEFLRRTADKTQRVAALAVSAEEALRYAQSRPKNAAMQKAVLELLAGLGSVSVKELCYFTGASAATVNRLEKLGFLTFTEREVLRCREIKKAVLHGRLVLNEQQMRCYVGITAQMAEEKPGAALLKGVTGSGKTSVYIKLIQACLEQKGSAMLLVPEIALTPQLLGLLSAYFDDQVAVLHSSLSAGERYDQWKRVKNGEARVVVGTRSAVFAPCVDLKLLILDEEQEHSYKSENTPRYSARDVALWRGDKENALVLLGSATPSVETMYRAKTGLYRLYTLPERYNGRSLPRVEIVDMRQELEFGNDSSYSQSLREAIWETAQERKQAILLLNRRGASRAMVCVDCRETPVCPRCSVNLTYHSANERMMCHYCGHSQPIPRRCPACGGPLKHVGTGTQKVQQELQRLFPDVQSLRMDADTVSAVNTHEKILDKFREENIPVLIGTQMVAKGLDMPNVTLVGVLDSDLSLYAPSFRAAETTFNMLTQVVGRAGRGAAPGKAVIQTLVPKHPVIELASRQDYDGFYDLEIRLRQMQNDPPFSSLVTITFVGEDEPEVLHGSVKFRDSLLYCLQEPVYREGCCTVLGPAPCVVPKINYNYRYRLTVKCRLTKPLRLLLAHLLRQFGKDKENRHISAFIDVNGFE